MSVVTRNDQNRIVITGAGCVSVLGDSPSEMLTNLLDGRSGIATWRRHGPNVFCRIGGDLSSFDLQAHLAGWPVNLADKARGVLRVSGAAGRIVAAAVFDALKSAGALDMCDDTMGHILGGHNLNEQLTFEQSLAFAADAESVEPLYGVVGSDIDPLASTNELFGIRGPSFTVGGACASSNVAVITALDLLRLGRAKRAIASGVSMIASPITLQSWAFMEAIALETYVDAPSKASRPFDVRREGFVPAEGAGAVVLETLASAKQRRAPIVAELLGGAITTAPSRGTRTEIPAQVLAMRRALLDAQVTAADIDYVNAHGTSTPLGDVNEICALRQVFGDHVRDVMINSSKSMLGHALQAASILELIAVVGQINAGCLHYNLNLDDPDKEFLDLDLVRGEARPVHITRAVSNAFGFGGMNAVIVVGRTDDR